MKWEVLLYVTSNGQAVVDKYLQKLDTITYAKVLRTITLLESYGADLGMPHAKPLGDGLVELRVRGKREVRIFYIFATKRRVFLLHGFTKKTQTTPNNELKIARDRQKEIQKLLNI